jgi:two-component system OmpR family sensor kinase/two-component system sensor histidine kinase BaeS
MKRVRSSLQGKLIVSYLAIALLTVVVVSVFIRISYGRSLMNLVMGQQTALLSDAVQTYYQSNGSLNGFFGYYNQQNGNSPAPSQTGTPNKPPKNSQLRAVHGLVDTEYRALLPTLGYDVGETVPADKIKNPVAVEADGQTIAWILPDTTHQFKLSPEEQHFLNRSNIAIGIAALAGILAAVLMGGWLSGRLIRPIRNLMDASKALARGDLNQQVPVTSQDELGLLTETFNQMSLDLDHADQQRKRMTADITHDLSTPLQIISGYVEMLENGNVPLTPERTEIIKTELDHLRRLVSDLKTLTEIESNGLDIHLQPVQPSLLMERIFHAYQPMAAQRNIELKLDAPLSPYILADEGRMLQVLKNLVDNALRYTPDDGWIELSVKYDGQVHLRVADNGSGIVSEDLPFIFDRFYRADKARETSAGHTGLGLSICKALVTAQGGSITAESKGRDQGTAMIISFAAATRQAIEFPPY